MQIICLDLEGVLVPEIWIEFSKRTGISELSRTTRDEPDYDKLMNFRIGLLAQHGLKLADIQDVIAGMGPMAGARDFLDDLRSRYQVIILSDTFYEFGHYRGDSVIQIAALEPVLQTPRYCESIRSSF